MSCHVMSCIMCFCRMKRHTMHSIKPTVQHHMHRVHPKFIEKMYDLVCEGVMDIQEVERALKHHVTHILRPDIKPDLTDHSYYHTSTNVRNHICKVQHAYQLSKLDQENLQLKIEKENPESLFHFCPYSPKWIPTSILSLLVTKIPLLRHSCMYVHQ